MEQVKLLCHHHFIEQLFAVVMATTPSPALASIQQKKGAAIISVFRKYGYVLSYTSTLLIVTCDMHTGVASKFSVWRHLTSAAKMAAAIAPQEKEPMLVESRLVCKLYHKCISLFSQVLCWCMHTCIHYLSSQKNSYHSVYMHICDYLDKNHLMIMTFQHFTLGCEG